MSAEPAILACEGLRKDYGERSAVRVGLLEARRGETLTVLGPSGSGKSTLLRLLGLLERPDAGRVLVDGTPVTTRSRGARLRMPLVFQESFLFRGTVADNVAFGLRMRRLPSAEREERTLAALDRVGLADRAGAAARRLSGGEAQRVALARALVIEPRILLLDEPLASLDTPLRRRLASEFARVIRESEATAVWVTHDQDEAAVVADRAAVLRDGEIVTSGGVDEVLGLPHDDWVAGFMGMEPPVRGMVTGTDSGLASVDCGGTIVRAVSDLLPGTRVRLGIRPEDVTLLEETGTPPASSARNRLRARVVEVRPQGSTHKVVVGSEGLTLAASVSRAAVAELGLVPGMPVVASFKATAVRLTAVAREGAS